MKVGYSQNSNKITEKSHLVNITFCFCLCLSFYTTWQLVVLCHISKLTFTNIWLGFNIPLHMDHSVSSLHCLPVQSEVENQSFPRENYGNFNEQAHFHDSLKTALILMHLHFKRTAFEAFCGQWNWVGIFFFYLWR